MRTAPSMNHIDIHAPQSALSTQDPCYDVVERFRRTTLGLANSRGVAAFQVIANSDRRDESDALGCLSTVSWPQM